MKLMDGVTYETDFGVTHTVVGSTTDYPDFIYTNRGDWFERETGKFAFFSLENGLRKPHVLSKLTWRDLTKITDGERDICVETVVNGFIEAVEFAESVHDGSECEDTSVQRYDGSLTQKAVKVLRQACIKRFKRLWPLLKQIPEEKMTDQVIGHCIYFNCVGAGVGFWDKNLGDLGHSISDVCTDEREMWLEVMVYPSRKRKQLLVDISG